MSDVPQQRVFSEQIAGRWQIPLLFLSVALLTWGVWRLRPEPQVPTFDELFSHAVRLREAGLYIQASDAVENLLTDPARALQPDQRHRLHREMVEILVGYELGNSVHGEDNIRRIIEHSDQSIGPDESFDAQMYYWRGLAYQWQRNETEAVAAYRQALAAGIDDPWTLRKTICEMEHKRGGKTVEQMHAEYDAFLSGVEVPEALRYWAAERKVELFNQEGAFEACERFLEAYAGQFTEPSMQLGYDYLRALAWYRVNRVDDAERLLRALRDRLNTTDQLYAASGWLLGRIMLDQEAPAYALGFFDEVRHNAPPSRYRAAAVWGRAEALAGLERHDESIPTYEEAIRLAAEDPYGTMIDLQQIRETTSRFFRELRQRGELARAREYLMLATRLVRPGDDAAQARYVNWLADVSYELGQRALRRAVAGETEETYPAKAYFLDAGEAYRRLNQLVSFDQAAATEATRRAAESFDLAGDRRRTMEVLEVFVKERPYSPFVPEALRWLGQTCQAAGDFHQAVVWYQRNITDHPRTPAAAGSLVPLAECFHNLGEADKAERTLLRIVDHMPGDPIQTITPEAREYREALFALGDLYTQAGEYEKGIARYTEALRRFGDDARAYRVTYLLADAYRLSARRIREVDLPDDTNVAIREQLRLAYRERLGKARELYAEVIDRYRRRSAETLTDLDELYVKLSWFYQADAVYDLSRETATPSLTHYQEALELYDKAAFRYKDDPIAMSAYVQMINCYLRLGNVGKGRQTLQRARWALRGITDEQFARLTPLEDRGYWEEYLNWLEATPVFVAEELARAD
ncbi:MAG: tetratricopeptide repeat protein [Phycisphaerales bacterium]|nr:tetratricopeptide repeat protein [Phycisphaerales bacterium]